MLAINIIAIVWIIAMILWFKPVQKSLLAVNTREDKGTGRDYRDAGLIIFAAVFAVSFLIRIIAGLICKGNETDMNCFIVWSDMVYNDGISNFYLSEAFHDYPPGYMYILYVVGAVKSWFNISSDSAICLLITKLPAIIADMVTGFLVYKIASKKTDGICSSILSAAYLLCPVIILDSAVWGQTDAVFVMFIVIMCYLLTEKKLIPSYFVFAIAILIKPQSLILTPVLICAIIDQVFLKDFNWKKFFSNLIPGLCAIVMIGLLMIPFGFNEALSQYTDTLGSYEYASVNAYNIWTVFGLNWAGQDGIFLGLTYQTWGAIAIVLTVIASILISIKCRETKSKYYFIGAFVVTCVFTFSVRMHERYLFPAVVLLLLCYVASARKEIYSLYTVISTVAFYNVAHVLIKFDVNNFDNMAPIPIVIGIAMVLSAVFMIYTGVKLYASGNIEKKDGNNIMKKDDKDKKDIISDDKKNPIKKSGIFHKMGRNDYIALGIIVVVYAVIAFVRLGNMSAPETEYSVVKDGVVTLDMGKEVTVSKLWDFLGYENNSKYYIEYTNDSNAEWTTLCGEGSEWDGGSVFAWNEKEINVSARFFRISPAPVNGNDSIMELVFTDPEGNLLMPANASDYPTLFDEQDMFDGRKSNMNGTYFDEIYHARTAYEMIHHLYCYENTHPPLGKLLIAAGVLIFGMNPFGWRFMGTLFGVLMIPVIYNFSKKFFKETWISIVTTLLFTFDFMHFVQTRIATIDVFVTLFIMLAYYFMYCYTKYSFYDTKLSKTFIPLGLCGISMGLSIASKWTGIYSAVGLCIIFFVQMYKRFREYLYAVKNPEGKTEGISHKYIADNFIKLFMKTIGFCCIFFILIPALIYLVSYIPFNDGTDRGLIEKIIVAQNTMFSYHSQLTADHPYSSTWYQWPIMYRPMWYYSGIVSDTVREGISAFGNPLVWWAGIPAALYMLYLIFKEKDKNAGFLVIGYLAQYAPWFFVTRVVFIYHYFPSVPFVTVMVGYSLYKLVQKWPSLKKWTYIYVALAIVLFIMFYPVLSGLPVNIHYVERFLKWFDSWVLIQNW